MSRDYDVSRQNTHTRPITDAPADPEPAQPFRDETVWHYLRRHGLLEKVIRGVINKARIPQHLYDDAYAEITYVLWMREARPDTDGKSRNDIINQVAGYAHNIGYHTAIRVWRDIGNPCRLPGSAFRTRKDGSTLVQPGHLAEPLAFEDMEEVIGDMGTEYCSTLD